MISPEVSVPVAVRSSPPEDWNALLDADPGADFFHTPAWTLATARHLVGGRPLWLTVHREGRLLGGLAAVAHGGRFARLHSSPHGCSGGALLDPDLDAAESDAVHDALVDELLRRRGGLLATCGVALNPVHEQSRGRRLAGDRRFRRQDNPAAVVPLNGTESDLEARLRRSKRKERDRSLRRGAEAGVSKDPADLAAYHRLHLAASRLWGTDPVPLDLLTELVASGPEAGGGQAYFVCVRCEGRVIGGHLNLHRGDWVTAWNGVTDPAFARTHYPATLAVWTDLVEAQRRGARWLDLGASGGRASLDFFKDGFGAEARDRGWYVADTPAARLVRALGRALPGRRTASTRRWHDPVPGSGIELESTP